MIGVSFFQMRILGFLGILGFRAEERPCLPFERGGGAKRRWGLRADAVEHTFDDVAFNVAAFNVAADDGALAHRLPPTSPLPCAHSPR